MTQMHQQGLKHADPLHMHQTGKSAKMNAVVSRTNCLRHDPAPLPATMGTHPVSRRILNRIKCGPEKGRNDLNGMGLGQMVNFCPALPSSALPCPALPMLPEQGRQHPQTCVSTSSGACSRVWQLKWPHGDAWVQKSGQLPSKGGGGGGPWGGGGPPPMVVGRSNVSLPKADDGSAVTAKD